jgi:hypothetical protein
MLLLTQILSRRPAQNRQLQISVHQKWITAGKRRPSPCSLRQYQRGSSWMKTQFSV